MFSQRGDDPGGGSQPEDLVRPGGQDGGIREAFQTDDENLAASCSRGRGDSARQHSATRDDAEPTWHFCLNIHFNSRQTHSFLATGKGFFAYTRCSYLTLQ